jgi:hypothetical protein
MRIAIKGVNSVRKRLSDGTMRTYFYAWKGGPRLPGNPGEPEFMAAYQVAITKKHKKTDATRQAVLNDY